MTKLSMLCEVECNVPGCNWTEYIELTREGQSYTDTHVNDVLRGLGWYAVDNTHYCPLHRPDAKKIIENGPCP